MKMLTLLKMEDSLTECLDILDERYASVSKILETLESYSRSGVPLYIYWKPGLSESKVLPSILTEQILLDSF